jgi:hypothetical protein
MAVYNSVLTGLEIDSSGAAIKNAVSGFTGSGAAQTADDLSIDNLKLDGNTLSATNAGGDVNLTPNGVGKVRTDNMSLDGNTISTDNSNGDLILAPNGTGIVMGVPIAFCHNYKDDAGTTENYLPWTDGTESASAGDRKAFLAPFDMVLNKLIWRMGSANACTMTIKVEAVDDGDPFTAGNTATIATATQIHDGTDHKVYSSLEANFNVQPIVPAGKLAVMTFQADVDANAADGDYFISSVWTLQP